MAITHTITSKIIMDHSCNEEFGTLNNNMDNKVLITSRWELHDKIMVSKISNLGINSLLIWVNLNNSLDPNNRASEYLPIKGNKIEDLGLVQGWIIMPLCKTSRTNLEAQASSRRWVLLPVKVASIRVRRNHLVLGSLSSDHRLDLHLQIMASDLINLGLIRTTFPDNNSKT